MSEDDAAAMDALRRWLAGDDDALDEWLRGRPEVTVRTKRPAVPRDDRGLLESRPHVGAVA